MDGSEGETPSVVGGWTSLGCLIASLWTAAHVLLGHYATTCTQGADGSWFSGAILSAPTTLLVWLLLIRMIRRRLADNGKSAALFCLTVSNVILLLLLPLGLQDVWNMTIAGALCGPDYASYAELSNSKYVVSRWAVAVYFVLTPVITLMLTFALIYRLRETK